MDEADILGDRKAVISKGRVSKHFQDYNCSITAYSV